VTDARRNAGEHDMWVMTMRQNGCPDVVVWCCKPSPGTVLCVIILKPTTLHRPSHLVPCWLYRLLRPAARGEHLAGSSCTARQCTAV
jgi:hypothetical protein